MRFLRIAALALIALLGVGTVGGKAAELAVQHRAYAIHHVHFASWPDGFYYPPYGYWQHAPWGFDWHAWGMHSSDWE
jgi:hypothetical protein